MNGFVASAFAIALALAGSTSATTVVLNENVDLTVAKSPNMPTFFGWRDFTTTGGAFSPTFSYTLAAGDSLDFTARFLSGQSLTLVNPNTFWLASFSTSGEVSGVNGTGMLTLLDTLGNPLFTSNLKTDDEGVVHFGQFFSPSDFAGLPSTVTIGGLHYVGTLNFYDNTAVTVRTYADPFIVFGVNAPSVPEPAAWVLMIAGFGITGLALRRRREEAVTA